MTNEENERDINAALAILQRTGKYDFGLVITISSDGHFGAKGGGNVEQPFQQELQDAAVAAVHRLLEERVGPCSSAEPTKDTTH